MKRIFGTVLLALFFMGGVDRLKAQEVYNESGGLVIMEMENTESSLNNWDEKTNLSGYTGSGFLQFDANTYESGPADSPLEYYFKINQAGLYYLQIHCAKELHDGRNDVANDAYVRVEGDYEAGPGPYTSDGDNASLSLLQSNTKYYGGAVNSWKWEDGLKNLDPGGSSNKRDALYDFKAGETYKLVVSGRSRYFRINRLMFRKTTVATATAQNLSNPESSTTTGGGGGETYTYDATTDFPNITAGEVPYYIHTAENALAINATVVADRGKFARAQLTFGGAAGNYDVNITSLRELDGECTYRFLVNGSIVGTAQNSTTTNDYNPENHIFRNISIPAGATLAVESNTDSNSQVSEAGDGNPPWAWARGRWTTLSLSPPEYSLVNAPAGRIAYVADGNSPDPDDIGANAVMFGLLGATELQDRLVHFSHSCDLIKASNISAADELRRQGYMHQEAAEGIAHFGPFNNLANYYNCRSNQTAAVANLTAAIDASTAADPLWIIEAGEPDIIGYALQAANASAIPHVHVVSHHPANDDSGDYFTWQQILDFGVTEHQIGDQNVGLQVLISSGLWDWAEGHSNPAIVWILDQLKYAEADGVVGFQDNKYDCSDAGMIYWWITGANNGGNKLATPVEIKEMLLLDPEGKNPVAHWKLDEASGTVAHDSSNYGNTGTLLNGASWSGDATRSSFVSFDGTDDRVSTLFTYALSSSDDFTWAWWANKQSADGIDGGAIMVGNRYPERANPKYGFIKMTPQRAEFANTGVAANIDKYNYTYIPQDEWHHYAMVKEGTSYQWYVDGAPGAAMNLNYSENSAIPFFIGGDDNGTGKVNEHFQGFIDDVVLYKRALSSSEVVGVGNGIYIDTTIPTANAGSDKTVYLPENQVDIPGAATDEDGTIASYLWTQFSGPSTASLSGANTAILSVGDLAAGTYIFRLTVTDNDNKSDSDDVSVVVVPEASAFAAVTSFTLYNADTDQPIPGFDPIVSGSTLDKAVAGTTSFNIQVNTSPTTDFGSVVMALSGATTKDTTEDNPVWALFGDTAGNFKVGALNDGAHTLTATPYDQDAGAGSAGTPLTINFTVIDQTGAPIADAGADQVVNVPASEVTLDGSGSDNGSITAYAWTQISGPNTAVLTDEATEDLTASGLVEGTYVFRLTVTDNESNQTSDDVNVSVVTPGSGSVIMSGELKQWHKVTLMMEGPTTSETATPNPFSDYRMNVTFTHPDSGLSYVVPGYFAADGNAANTGATSGNKWVAHLSPDHTGIWNYTVSFRTGTDVAMDSNVAAGSAVTPFDNTSGSFSVSATDKTGRDHRGKGRLEYVNKHHLQFAGTGEYFLKAGTDAPENMLAYNDIDATPNDPNGLPNLRKTWSPHAGDYDATDAVAYTWNGGKGSELLGAIKYLADEGVNAFSFLTFGLDGDDDNVFPHLLRGSVADYESVADNGRWANTTKGVHHDRFDVSKMTQWEKIFEYGDKKGMYLHFKTQETENDQMMDGGALGRERKIYYRELVARYGHHLAMNWNLGEENTNTTAEEKAFAQWFLDNDPYRHNVVLHTYPAAKAAKYTPLLGAASKLTGLSLQTKDADFKYVFPDTLDWVQQSASAGKPWVVACDEPGDANHALRPVGDEGNSWIDGRKNALWGNVMAGGAGVEFYFGYQHANSDMTCQDFRSRDGFWDYCRYMLAFFNNNDVPFWDMANQDSLVSNANAWCLRKPGESYVVYLKNGGTTTLNLSGTSGSYEVRWFDPRNGGSLQNGSVTSVSGGSTVSLGTAPSSTTSDWVVLVSLPAADAPPTISDINDLTIFANTATDPLAFTIGDSHTAATALTLSKASSNTGLVPEANVVFGGSGANRTVTVTPAASEDGSAVISVIVNDGVFNTTNSFELTVLPEGSEIYSVTNNTAGTTAWICPTGVTAIQVECWGGGGAGGAADAVDTANVGGGGGAGGAYASKASVAVTPGNSYDLTIPAAATAPAGAANGARFNGAAVSFIGDSSVTVTATGGQGGESRIGSGNISGTGGAASTAGCNGDVVYAGGNGSRYGDRHGGGGGGGAGNATPGGDAIEGTAGIGGLDGGGDGGGGRSGNGNGKSGSNPGGGGGGAKSQSSQGGDALYGGIGGLGQIIVTYILLPAVEEPPILDLGMSGGDMVFNWTGNGFKVQSRTNLTDGVWVDVPDGDIPPVNVIPTNSSAFFRLIEN